MSTQSDEEINNANTGKRKRGNNMYCLCIASLIYTLLLYSYLMIVNCIDITFFITGDDDPLPTSLLECTTDLPDNQTGMPLVNRSKAYSSLSPAMLRTNTMFPNAAILNSHLHDNVSILSHSMIKDLSESTITETAAIGILYHIKHYQSGRNDSSNEKEKERNMRITSRNTQQVPSYNRIFFFGTPEGKTFCIIYNNQSAAQTAFQYMPTVRGAACWTDTTAIGRAFVILEPRHVKDQTLRKDMIIITTDKPVIPLKDSFVSLLKNIPTLIPDSDDEDRFFLAHNQKVDIRDAALYGAGAINKLSCSGGFCDRQGHPLSGIGCGCFVGKSNGGESDYVMKVGLYFKDIIQNQKDKTFGTIPSITDFRSLRLTEFFVRRPNEIGTCTSEQRITMEIKLRPCVNKLSDIVNEVGGFTIMGVVRKGKVADESDRPEDRKTSKSKLFGDAVFTPSYVYPTRFEEILNHPDYPKLTFWEDG
jgi:hypothetical protein